MLLFKYAFDIRDIAVINNKSYVSNYILLVYNNQEKLYKKELFLFKSLSVATNKPVI